MSQPILVQDSDQAILLEAPRGASIVLAALAAGALLAVRLVLPSLVVAQGLLGLATVWLVSRALQIHRLHLDLEHRTYRYHHGWRFAPPRRTGSLDEIACIAIEDNASAAAMASSRLRSRLVVLELKDWDERSRDESSRDGSAREGNAREFVLGFPMGPKVAVEKAADYARRLGVEVVDRTVEGEKDQP